MYSSKEGPKGIRTDFGRDLVASCDRNVGAGCVSLPFSTEITQRSTELMLIAYLYEKACGLGRPIGCAYVGNRHLWGKNILTEVQMLRYRA